MLANAGDPHNRKGWLWELKYDGYRVLAYKNNREVRLITRNGLDLADRFPEVCQVLTHLPESTFLMDGELVAHTEDGRPSFAMMQTRARSTSLNQVAKTAIEQPAKLYVFDLLCIGEHDLRDCKLTERKEVQYFIARSAEDLAYLANMGTIPVHMWHATTRNLDHPDWCVLDLDPKQAPFADVITLAKAIRELTDELDLPAYAKTSGASGLHVLIPLAQQLTHDQSQTLGELLARVMVARHPDSATITRAVRGRGKKVYVDYLQNGHGRLIVAPYSVRAESAASVSMPINWSEITGRLTNDKFHIGNAIARMKRAGAEPMQGLLEDEPDLLPALEKLAKLLA